MLALTITLTTLSAWTYGGFLAAPANPRVEPINDHVILISETQTRGKSTNRHDIVSSPADVRSSSQNLKTESVLPQPETPPETGAIYQLADMRGQIWEHADPVWLQEFVRNRNLNLLSRSQ